MKKIPFLLAMALLAIQTGCYYDVEEELYPDITCDTAARSYSTHIVPILQNNCYVCHSQAANLGNVTLEGYNNLKTYVNSGKLLGAIKHQQGFQPMPQGQPQLADCSIAQIEAWITDGALDN
jgi:hypothetical protein